MKEARHTPGPWKVFHFGGAHIGQAETAEAICAMWGWHKDPADSTRANATLIAAAPELLDALKTVTDRFRTAMISNGTDPEYADLAVQQFNETIAKAEGRR